LERLFAGDAPPLRQAIKNWQQTLSIRPAAGEKRRGSHAEHRHDDQDQALPKLGACALNHRRLKLQTHADPLAVHFRDIQAAARPVEVLELAAPGDVI